MSAAESLARELATELSGVTVRGNRIIITDENLEAKGRKMKQQRHHSAHPATEVRPNLTVNPKPEAYTPEKAAMPTNPNPSLGAVVSPPGLDVANSRIPHTSSLRESDEVEDPCDVFDDADCDDRNKQTAVY